MSSYEIPDEYWEEDHDSELPLDHRYWRPSPPNTVDYENVDDDGMPLVEHAFEEGAVSITINQLLSAHRAREDSVREARHAATDAHLESGEFRLHRPPDEDTHVPIPRGAFAEVSALEYNFVHGYVLRGSALFWEPLLPDWRRVLEMQSLVNYLWNVERSSDAFWYFTFRYIPGVDTEVEAFIRLHF